MRIAERVACIFWLALSATVGVGSYNLGLGTPQQPESGFLPFWTAILLCLLSLVHLIKLSLPASSKDHLGELTWGEHWNRVVALVVALAIYAIALPTFGYLISTFLLMAVLFSLYKRRKWWVVLGASLVVIGITHVIFHFWLNVQLPQGILRIG
jgi:hypothetical protein